MKKLLFLIAALFLFVGCSNDNTEPVETENVGENEMELEEVNITNEPMEFANKNNDYDTIEYENDVYHIKERYSNEETDSEGFNHVSFDGYDYTFAVMVVEDNMTGESYIALVGETENNTDKIVQFNSDVEILTDTQEQVNNLDGVGNSKPNIKRDAFVLVPVKEIPNEIDMTMERPWTESEEGEQQDYIGEDVKFSFTKE